MRKIENVILNSKNLSFYSQLKELIQNSGNLSESELQEFYTIWEVASDFSNWNDSDLILGCKITHQRLKETFNMSDECIAIIVRIASYDWK